MRREPRWVVSVLTYSPEQHQAVRQALDAATHPAVQALAELTRSRYPAETKERMAAFVEELAVHALSWEEAAHLSSDVQTYFRTLVALYLRDPAGEHRAIAHTLAEESSTLVLDLNSLFEQPAAIRFRAMEPLAARELYLEISANKFTNDEQGINDIDQVLRARKATPSVIVHRGHSIYVDRTLEKLPATAALIYLGNCGGNTLLETILGQAPTAHIMTTRGIGTVTINAPLLKALNSYLLHGKAMTWQRFWRPLEARLGQNPRFMDYVPPDKNASVVFLRAYHSLTADAKTASARTPGLPPS